MHAYAGPACICRMHAPSMLIPPTQPMHAGRTYALCTPLICCICEHSRCHISAKFKATQLVGISPRLFIPPKGIFAEMSPKLPELWRRYRRGKWPHFLSLEFPPRWKRLTSSYRKGLCPVWERNICVETFGVLRYARRTINWLIWLKPQLRTVKYVKK